MPKLLKIQTRRMILPSTTNLPEDQQIYVEHKDTLTVSDLMAYDKDASDMVNAVNILAQIITAWNIVDDNDQPLPITAETIGLLPAVDLSPLVEVVQQLTPDMKGTVSEAEKKV